VGRRGVEVVVDRDGSIAREGGGIGTLCKTSRQSSILDWGMADSTRDESGES
jgi:hypothetical protein